MINVKLVFNNNLLTSIDFTTQVVPRIGEYIELEGDNLFLCGHPYHGIRKVFIVERVQWAVRSEDILIPTLTLQDAYESVRLSDINNEKS